MEKPSKLVRFVISGKYFSCWKVFFVILMPVVVIYIVSGTRTKEYDQILFGGLNAMCIFFFLGNAIRNQLVNKYQDYIYEEEMYAEEKEVKEPFIKKNIQKIQKFLICGVILCWSACICFSLFTDLVILGAVFQGFAIVNMVLLMGSRHYSKDK